MSKKWNIECVVCKKDENFNDVKDIGQSHWHILGWDVGNNTPICVCNKCEYVVNKVAKIQPTEEAAK